MMPRPVGVLLAAVILVPVVPIATAADASPTISLSVHARPVAGFPRTGNIAGAGASLEAAVAIHGSEYGGYPPPLTGLRLTLPRGMKWNQSGFPTCYRGGLQPVSPAPPRGCPRESSMPLSSAQFAVAFGASIVPEAVTVQAIYSATGGLYFEVFGHEPVLLEVRSRAVVAAGNSNRTLEVAIPLVETVPGASDASIIQLTLLFGSGINTAHNPRFSLHMPRRCPHGRLRFQLEAAFAGAQPQRAFSSYSAPCPKRARPAKRR